MIRKVNLLCRETLILDIIFIESRTLKHYWWEIILFPSIHFTVSNLRMFCYLNDFGFYSWTWQIGLIRELFHKIIFTLESQGERGLILAKSKGLIEMQENLEIILVKKLNGKLNNFWRFTNLCFTPSYKIKYVEFVASF